MASVLRKGGDRLNVRILSEVEVHRRRAGQTLIIFSYEQKNAFANSRGNTCEIALTRPGARDLVLESLEEAEEIGDR